MNPGVRSAPADLIHAKSRRQGTADRDLVFAWMETPETRAAGNRAMPAGGYRGSSPAERLPVNGERHATRESEGD